MTVFMLPIQSDGNKYIELLVRSLERQGLSVRAFNKKRIWRMKRGDSFHIHWPSYHYTGRNRWITGAKAAVFLSLLLILRARGLRIVWTVHNVWPHRSGETRYDRRMRTWLCALCSHVIVMGPSVKDEVRHAFRVKERKIVCIPHGHYRDAYASAGLDVRERHGIPADAYLFAFIGQVSPYKGIDQLLRSFGQIQDARTHLLIAGRPSADFDAAVLADAGDRVHLSLTFVQDDELADYIRCADAIVLPYKKITTSGSAILALSYATPVVAPDVGVLRDYLTPDTALLYDPSDDGGLASAMAEMRAQPSRYSDIRRYEEKLRELDWTRVSAMMSGLYGKTESE
ncbi:glycosyltransferase family 4 protein [Cohnella nanjingensis]|uniref:Glycosyltransferase family 4 protein n=1 Tax=Cohnella nanjingensis TaxID=1387779 RepID=A0A7X0RQQ2_9BACL|nr:glycosyltransferase family 4 protein [Cohnella nanjingensis]MBB6671728.1 glycosyltransferase family 4 protein [Cohnella nanjingensis]